MGWAIIVGRIRRQFQIANLLKVDSKPEFSKNKHFRNCNVSKCPYESYIERKKKISLLL
jgi:hypothetical protein